MTLEISLPKDKLHHSQALIDILERIPHFEAVTYVITLEEYDKVKLRYIKRKKYITLDDTDAITMLVDYLIDFLEGKCSLDIAQTKGDNMALTVKIGNVKSKVC